MSKIIPYVNSIFQQPWWLDAVAPNQWSEVIVKNNNEIVARLPYTLKRKYGLTIIGFPPLTQTLGPWLKPSSKAKLAKQLSEQKQLMTSLIEQLPQYDHFVSNFNYSIQNWLPFYWNGFSQTTRYTYLIEDLTDIEKIWNGFENNIRTDIRKAEKLLKVYSGSDIEQCQDIIDLTFRRQGKSPSYTREYLRRIDAACSERQARRIFFAEDSKARIHAVDYIVWDENSAHGLLAGADPELRASGASSLLRWEAIKFAATVTKQFNFGGSMIESIEHFIRDFGCKQIPYFQVTRMSRRMKLLISARDIIKVLVETE